MIVASTIFAVAVVQDRVVPWQDDGSALFRPYGGALPIPITDMEREFIALMIDSQVRTALCLLLGVGATVFLLDAGAFAAVAAAAAIGGAAVAIHRWRMNGIQRRLRTPARLETHNWTLLQRVDSTIGRVIANLLLRPILIAATAAALYFGFRLAIPPLQIIGSWGAAAVVTNAWQRYII